MNQIKKCPHCGSAEGLYNKYTYKDVRGFYDFDGNFTEESFDSAYPAGGKNLYCISCGKLVCRLKRLRIKNE